MRTTSSSYHETHPVLLHKEINERFADERASPDDIIAASHGKVVLVCRKCGMVSIRTHTSEFKGWRTRTARFVQTG